MSCSKFLYFYFSESFNMIFPSFSKSCKIETNSDSICFSLLTKLGISLGLKSFVLVTYLSIFMIFFCQNLVVSLSSHVSLTFFSLFKVSSHTVLPVTCTKSTFFPFGAHYTWGVKFLTCPSVKGSRDTRRKCFHK